MGLLFGTGGVGTKADRRRLIADIERVKKGEFVFIPEDEYDDKELVRAANALTLTAMDREETISTFRQFATKEDRKMY